MLTLNTQEIKKKKKNFTIMISGSNKIIYIVFSFLPKEIPLGYTGKRHNTCPLKNVSPF